jgi:topoisomerase-4 subunit A
MNEVHLSDLYRDLFLDYASYVVLERAVPHINDGLKPVQRRLLHTLYEMEDGRFNKVAKIVGSSMQFHPHGDASLAAALVGLGQKELLIDTQGNWGSVITGDAAAAPRYIEARLSKFALDVLFNPKTTEWQPSYDGRNREPVTLPAKFPLLLVQGVEGIAVGMACKILPHNFNEIIEAAIAILKGKTPQMLPDFPQGGIADFSDYQKGRRGGKVRVRAKIEVRTKLLLAITEVPYGTTTKSLIESIIAANDKEKIRIRKVEDNTASSAEILLHLPPGADPHKTISALYCFTDCEVSHSPNAAVISKGKPMFTDVIELLRYSTQQTEWLLKRELEIRLDEIESQWHAANLEKIFIEEKLYRLIEQAASEEEAVGRLQKALEPFRIRLHRHITREDIVRLIELRFRRLAKYDVARADQDILRIETEIANVRKDIERMTEVTIRHYQTLKQKYGKGRERRTKSEAFNEIVAAAVAEANEKLYVNKADGFVGYALKDQEFVANCSTLDEVVTIFKNGTMKVTLVQEKAFVGKDILHASIVKKNGQATSYHMIYRDGPGGRAYVKRFNIGGTSRDKLYDLTQGTEGSRVEYLAVSPAGACETIRVNLKPGNGARKLDFEFDFSTLAVKNRHAQGNVLTKYPIQKISLTKL